MTAVPPSLDRLVAERAWRARNGELGLLCTDVGAFLDACERDEATVLGWELWVVDHAPGEDFAADPAPAPGRWFGLIPTPRGGPAVFGGTGDAAATRGELAALALDEAVDPRWHRFIRVNVTVRVTRSRSRDGVA